MSLSFSANTVILYWKKTHGKHRDLVMEQPPVKAGGCFFEPWRTRKMSGGHYTCKDLPSFFYSLLSREMQYHPVRSDPFILIA